MQCGACNGSGQIQTHQQMPTRNQFSQRSNIGNNVGIGGPSSDPNLTLKNAGNWNK